MSQTLRFVLALHNHQPVGNFDGVFEQAYRDSYLPFLDVFESYASLPISLHTSGSLMEWLQQRHPEYVDRLAGLVARGRVEVLGGAYYEAILSMIPPRDRVGQIRQYSDWLHRRFGAEARGMWMPERVWEQCLVSDLSAADIRYTILDDFHFKNAGLTSDQLHGYYVTEDCGKLVSVFPGSEQLRYLIPFGSPQQTIDYLGEIARKHPGSVVVFGDDGEKFGSWPETKKHVYEDGWLARFFDALVANESWLKTTTLGEAVDNVAPVGKIYLPDSSYREMTEWVLPTEQLLRYEDLRHDLEKDPRWPRLQQFMRGGFWRNFKVKYPEADEMYARMMMVSDRLADCPNSGKTVEQARTELHRAQCNCAYWHGAFGGIYLPHLRNAIYNHLIAADNLLDRAQGKSGGWVQALVGDFNLDARQEVSLSNDRLFALFAPARGGQMYELDIRSICHNLLATLARRPEAYHQKVLAGEHQGDDDVASIHDRVVFKQADLDKHLQYDKGLRKSLTDHFYDNDARLSDVADGRAMQRGDFFAGVYKARLRRAPDRVQAVFSRQGNAWGHPLRITKSVSVEAGSSTLSVNYLLEDLPETPLHFAVELNFAGLPAGADDRYFHDSQDKHLGQLGARLDLAEVQELGLIDEYLGIDVGLKLSKPSEIWTFPVETVSQSEGGFELVHQSVVVQPHWLVQGDAEGKWQVSFDIHIDTSLAESRVSQRETVAV